MSSQYSIRQMLKSNLDEVMEIEKDAFGSHHWSRDAFYNELANNLAKYFCIFNENDEIVAYSGHWHVIDEAHITTFAVKKDCRRKKLGELLMKNIIEDCYKNEIKYITLEVRVSNTPAIKLYEKYGFKSLGARKAYYQDNNEDALIMWTENIFWSNFKDNYEKQIKSLSEVL